MAAYSPVSIQTQSLALRALCALRKQIRKKRKRLRWQAANHGCHCFDRTFLLAGAYLRFLFTQRMQRKLLHLNGNRAYCWGCG